MAEKLFFALDVGGTNINAGVVSLEGKVLARRSFPTLPLRGSEAVIGDMVANLELLASEIKTGNPEAVVVGMPGWLNQREGVLIQAPNMPGCVNVPIVEILKQKMNLPVFLENDTNLYALGEWLYGAGRDLGRNLIVVTLGTGVGGGLILDGKLWNGSFASAAEIGHMPIGFRGDLCGCGRRGCLETVASATAMARLAQKWLADKGASNQTSDEITTETLHHLAQQGDVMALSVFKKAGEALGLVLVSIFNLLGLEGAVIGGGAAGAYEFIEPHVRKVINSRLIVADPLQVKIVKDQLGDDAPLLGAAALLNRF